MGVHWLWNSWRVCKDASSDLDQNVTILSHYLFIIKIPILRYIYFDLHIMMLLAVMTLHTFKRIKDVNLLVNLAQIFLWYLIKNNVQGWQWPWTVKRQLFIYCNTIHAWYHKLFTKQKCWSYLFIFMQLIAKLWFSDLFIFF